MLVLALDSALGHCCAGIVRDGVVIAARAAELTRGHPAVLPMMARDVLAEAALRPSVLDMVAVTVGPGSFTGVRAGLALAHGIGLGAGRPVIAVSVGEALAALSGGDGGELHWSTIDSRRGRIFLECAGKVVAVALADLPAPPGPVTISGDAAAEAAAALAGRGFHVTLAERRYPEPAGIASAAMRRAICILPPRAAQPIYVDAPAVTQPGRPPPFP